MKTLALKHYHFLDDLEKVPAIKRIILFGSRARGDHTARSDIDIAIDGPDITDDGWHRILDIIEQADTLLAIDCVRLDTFSVTNPLRKSIERDGIVMYRRDTHVTRSDKRGMYQSRKGSCGTSANA